MSLFVELSRSETKLPMNKATGTMEPGSHGEFSYEGTSGRCQTGCCWILSCPMSDRTVQSKGIGTNSMKPWLGDFDALEVHSS